MPRGRKSARCAAGGSGSSQARRAGRASTSARFVLPVLLEGVEWSESTEGDRGHVLRYVRSTVELLMNKILRITAKQAKDGIRIVRGHMDVLIIEDVFGPGLLVSVKPRPTGKEVRPIRLVIKPTSTATVLIEGET